MNRSTFDAMLAQYSKEERTGDGSVSWDKGARCVIPKVEIGGKGEQKQYSGKNLLDVNSVVWIPSAGGGEITVNDGTLTVDMKTYFVYTTLGNIPEHGKTFTLTVDILEFTDSENSILVPSIVVYIVGGSYVEKRGSVSSPGKCVVTATIKDTDIVDHIEIRPIRKMNNTSMLHAVCTNIQVEIGTSGEYEPYTGGIPAPNPNYPIMPVFSEGTTVVGRGRNLWDVPTWYREYSINNRLKLIGDKTIFLSKGTYTVSFYYRNITSKETTSFARTYSEPISEVATAKQLQYWALGLSTDKKDFSLVVMTITLTADSWFGLDDGQLRGGFEYKNIQIEEGTTATPYTPYFDGGTATAPELLAIPGTEYRDTWATQTGKGVRRCAVIESYNGEEVTTPFISSTGQLTEGAYVVYGIPDEPFQTEPQPLIQPPGVGQIIQTGGTLEDCPITVTPVTHQ